MAIPSGIEEVCASTAHEDFLNNVRDQGNGRDFLFDIGSLKGIYNPRLKALGKNDAHRLFQRIAVLKCMEAPKMLPCSLPGSYLFLTSKTLDGHLDLSELSKDWITSWEFSKRKDPYGWKQETLKQGQKVLISDATSLKCNKLKRRTFISIEREQAYILHQYMLSKGNGNEEEKENDKQVDGRVATAEDSGRRRSKRVHKKIITDFDMEEEEPAEEVSAKRVRREDNAGDVPPPPATAAPENNVETTFYGVLKSLTRLSKRMDQKGISMRDRIKKIPEGDVWTRELNKLGRLFRLQNRFKTHLEEFQVKCSLEYNDFLYQNETQWNENPQPGNIDVENGGQMQLPDAQPSPMMNRIPKKESEEQLHVPNQDGHQLVVPKEELMEARPPVQLQDRPSQYHTAPRPQRQQNGPSQNRDQGRHDAPPQVLPRQQQQQGQSQNHGERQLAHIRGTAPPSARSSTSTAWTDRASQRQPNYVNRYILNPQRPGVAMPQPNYVNRYILNPQRPGVAMPQPNYVNRYILNPQRPGVAMPSAVHTPRPSPHHMPQISNGFRTYMNPQTGRVVSQGPRQAYHPQQMPNTHRRLVIVDSRVVIPQSGQSKVHLMKP